MVRVLTFLPRQAGIRGGPNDHSVFLRDANAPRRVALCGGSESSAHCLADGDGDSGIRHGREWVKIRMWVRSSRAWAVVRRSRGGHPPAWAAAARSGRHSGA